MRAHQTVQVPRHHGFGVAVSRFGAGACAAVVRRDDAVAGFGEGRDDVPELVRGLGEAVDEEDGAFAGGGVGWGRAVDVGDPDVFAWGEVVVAGDPAGGVVGWGD